ncbi:hypothetical protein [Algihabitans albus]|uniref:hypothetical protein n=1 Tax=Algihabitans albus TaxID=2164067 RepID=UPI000E5CEC8D|nr:hypothetical protein [Algihabitans albus]
MSIATVIKPANCLYWIDDLGHWHRVDPASPFEHLREPIAERQQGHAFRWLGMVRALVQGGCLHAKWDVRHVDPQSLKAIETCILHERYREIHLDFFHGGWNREVFTDRQAAARRLDRTRHFRNVAFIAPLTVARLSPYEPRLERSEIEREDVPVTARALAAWDASERIWAEDRPITWLAEHLLVMSPPRARQTSALVHHIGAQHAIAQALGTETAQSLEGQLCSFPWLLPDQLNRLLRAYREVVASGRPHLEDVRSLIVPDGEEPAWVPYRRLLLPSHTAKGDPLVLCVAEIRQDISIPFMGEAA